MKIRIIGKRDLVDAWSKELNRSYGIKPALYPSRYSDDEIRAYFDLDDRQAAEIVGLPATSSSPPPPFSRKRLRRGN